MKRIGVIRKPLLQIAALFGAAFFVFVSQIILARNLDEYTYGQISSLFSLSSVAGVIASFGFGQYLINSVNDDRCKQETRNLILLSLLFSLGVAFSLLGCWFFIGDRFIWGLAFFIFVPLQALNNLAFSNAQRALNFSHVAFNRLQVPTLRLVSAVSVFFFDVDFFLVIFFLLSLVLSIKIVFLELSFRLAGSWRLDFSVIRRSISYGMESLVSVFLLNICVITMGWEKEFESLAAFNVAMSFIVAIYLLPQAVFINYLYPKVIKQDKVDSLRVFRRLLVFACGAAFFSICGVIFLWAAGKDIIGIFYGARYVDTAYVALCILAMSIPFRFFLVAIGNYISTSDSINRRVVSGAISIVAFFGALALLSGERDTLTQYSYAFLFSQIILSLSYMIFSVVKYLEKKCA